MTKTLHLCLITVIITASGALLSSDALALEKNTMTYKLRRGLANIVTSPVEIPKQMINEYEAHESEKIPTKVLATAGGLFKGVGYTVLRLSTGLWDALTFNVEIPANFEPVFEPEYVFDRWNE